jgi:acyl carrier protein
MEINKFIKQFASQFEETSIEVFKPETNFRDLGEWDSLIALSVIAMIDEDYEKQISGAELRGVNTIQELFNLVKSK